MYDAKRTFGRISVCQVTLQCQNLVHYDHEFPSQRFFNRLSFYIDINHMHLPR
jgi:hypothetical protein